ncbi:MAG: DUF2795 domain-containing protein [Methanomicrobiales archaeon]|nr:DUF2795 domain-containing protein [Methanomicrobiales archaeon]
MEPSVRGGEESLRTPGSASQFQSYTKGIDYPKSKREVVEYMRRMNAPDEVIREAESLPDQEFRSAADLSQAFGKIR